ncbi:hypothetical protein ACWEZE_12835 [Staphylococcus shinii]|uniref:hypothetical protein n=1 Tax=Staphylococcus shinii TaxID=2912228 RepID=UPI000C336483|nr:hypothetical protein [Staphylococcus shinii]PKI08363.1 hypothetical protein CW747_12610 [Staphylococcus shinii]
MKNYFEIKGNMVSGASFITHEQFEGEYDLKLLCSDIKKKEFVEIIPQDKQKIFYDTKLIESFEINGPFNEEEAQDRLDRYWEEKDKNQF